MGEKETYSISIESIDINTSSEEVGNAVADVVKFAIDELANMENHNYKYNGNSIQSIVAHNGNAGKGGTSNAID